MDSVVRLHLDPGLMPFWSLWPSINSGQPFKGHLLVLSLTFLAWTVIAANPPPPHPCLSNLCCLACLITYIYTVMTETGTDNPPVLSTVANRLSSPRPASNLGGNFGVLVAGMMRVISSLVGPVEASIRLHLQWLEVYCIKARSALR